MLGELEAGLADLERAEKLTHDPYNDYLAACASAGLGHDADVYRFVARTLEAEPSYAENFRQEDEFARYRGDARFLAALSVHSSGKPS